MQYRIEVLDAWGRRVASFDETPLLEASRNGPDAADRIRGLLPKSIARLGLAYWVRVYVEGRLFCQGRVTWTGPEWGDARKLVIDEYVSFREVVPFEARGETRAGNTAVAGAYVNREVSAIVKDLVNRAPGPVHYTVAHTAYPEGAMREYTKFQARKSADNALETGGIGAGQWAGGTRIDASEAYAKDGRTIAGLRVDGVAWPDLRLLMVDAEDLTLTGRAVGRYPDIAGWTPEQYAASGYKLRADAAKAALQDLLDTYGISDVELNPHVDAAGNYDFRQDADGCYVGLAYGAWRCFNAALIELGAANVTLHGDGALLPPEMALKEYYSYQDVNTDSIDTTDVSMGKFQPRGGVLEALCALAYLADGYVFSVDPALRVRFAPAGVADRVVVQDSARTTVRLGAARDGLCTELYVRANPLEGAFDQAYTRDESTVAYGAEARSLDYYAVSHAADAGRLAKALLDDLAYPEVDGEIRFARGDAALMVGGLVELRGEPLRRLDAALPGRWGGRFAGKLAGRVRAVTHRFSGHRVETTAWLTSPLRSVRDPLAFIARSQESEARWFAFRLDDASIGLDAGWHLD